MPLFYTRGTGGIPRGWTAKMKEAMRELCPRFNSNRMVCEYVTDYYVACASRSNRMTADGCRRARAFTQWAAGVRDAWPKVAVSQVHVDGAETFRVGQEIKVTAHVTLGPLTPGDVIVQIYHGRLDERGEIRQAEIVPMRPAGDAPAGGVYAYAGSVVCGRSGRRGLAVRVLPAHEDQLHPHALRLIHWAD